MLPIISLFKKGKMKTVVCVSFFLDSVGSEY